MSSLVFVDPEVFDSAAQDLTGIGSAIRSASSEAASSTTQLAVAGQDEVSAAVAGVFGKHAQQYQALIARAGLFHEEFTANLRAAADSYVFQDASAQLASWERGLENLPGLPGQVAGTVATATASVPQEFGQILTSIRTYIHGSPAGPPIPASQHPEYTGTPSLFTRIENMALYGLKAVGIDFANQIAPAISSTSPPTLLTRLLGETVTQSTYDGMTVLQIAPDHPTGHYVVALHGGAFVVQPTILHWLDYTMMASQTGATIEVPLYPLVQQGGTAGTVVPEMANFIESEITAHGAPNVSVYGDSAGGTIALAAAEYMVANNMTVPASMVLLSPGLDLSLTNPNISLVNDPVLIRSSLQQDGLAWAGNLPLNDPLVSPLFGSLQGLPPTTVYSGSLEILAPDTLRLVQEAAVQDPTMGFVLRSGESHDWALAGLGDGAGYRAQIYQELGI